MVLKTNMDFVALSHISAYYSFVANQNSIKFIFLKVDYLILKVDCDDSPSQQSRMSSFLSSFVRVNGKISPTRNVFLIQSSDVKFLGTIYTKYAISFSQWSFMSFVISGWIFAISFSAMKLSNIGNNNRVLFSSNWWRFKAFFNAFVLSYIVNRS